MNSDFEDISVTTKSAFASFKKFLFYLKERKYFAAIKEFFNCSKIIYDNHLKGKYIEIKGKRISRTALVLIALLGMYVLYPASETPQQPRELPLSETQNAKKETNTYERNGLKVYDLRKCDNEVCGYIENSDDKVYPRIVVMLTFHNESGAAVYEGGAEALDVQPRTRIKITIPCEEHFAYFKLKNVEIEE